MRIASTPEMATGEDRRPLPPSLPETSLPMAHVSRADGHVISVNTATERLFGYAHGALRRPPHLRAERRPRPLARGASAGDRATRSP